MSALVELDELLDVLAVARADAPLRNSIWHGEQHWQCVARIATRLASVTQGADVGFALLFAVLHDCRRVNERRDPDHGRRAARVLGGLRAAGRLTLSDEVAETLCDAIALHNDGLTTEAPMVAVCWDADRLCLPRVGIEPSPELMSTPAALATRDWVDEILYAPLADWSVVLREALTQTARPAPEEPR